MRLNKKYLNQKYKQTIRLIGNYDKKNDLTIIISLMFLNIHKKMQNLY